MRIIFLLPTLLVLASAGLDSVTILNPKWVYDIKAGTISNGTTTMLAKRKDITACEDRLWRGATLFGSAAGAAAAWFAGLKGIAYMVKDLSNQHNCGVAHASLSGIKYVYSASGRNCDTTAEVGTVIGGLDKLYRNAIANDPNSVYCIEISHGGTWNGYLLVGPDENWSGSIWCGPTTRNTCVSGGKGDVQKGYKRRDIMVEAEAVNGSAIAWDGGVLYLPTDDYVSVNQTSSTTSFLQLDEL